MGANYIEANESLSKKDFLMRIKICRKEVKECRYFLRLVDTRNKIEGWQSTLEEERDWLVNESTELMKIFGAIVILIFGTLVLGFWIGSPMRFGF